MMTQDSTDQAQDQTQYVTYEEAADLLKDELERNGWTGGANTIKSWAYRKNLPVYKRGRRQVINLAEVRAYIREHGLQGEVRPWDR